MWIHKPVRLDGCKDADDDDEEGEDRIVEDKS